VYFFCVPAGVDFEKVYMASELLAGGFTPNELSPQMPCLPFCEHSQCSGWRRIIFSICRLCDQSIGWGERFDEHPELGIVHSECLEQAEQVA
jgi:hypothetical protein